MEECVHLLIPESCATCKHGVEPTFPKKKVRKKRQKPRRKASYDLAEQYTIEIMTGHRCGYCFTLRVGSAMQCAHEREEVAEMHIAAIEEFVAANPDVKGKLVQTASAAALSRVTLRAGLRNAPSDIEGLSLGGLLGLGSRVGFGRAMEWRDQRPSGDPLPC